MPLYEVGDETDAETAQQAIYKVAQRSSDTGAEGRPTAFGQRALDDEHTYRPHRRRDEDADEDASGEYVE